MSQGEIDSYEMEDNQKKYGCNVTDDVLLEEIACQACRLLESSEQLSNASVLIQKWWKLHKAKDAKK